MNTHPHLDNNSEDSASADCASADQLYRAYGRRVQELLSQSDAETWIEDLWDMDTGFTLFSQEAGYDPRGHDRFVSFKELVFFFQHVGRIDGITGRPWQTTFSIPVYLLTFLNS